MPNLTPFNTYPGSEGGWVQPTMEEIKEVCDKIEPLEFWRKQYSRNAHKAGSNQTIGNHLGLTAQPVAAKLRSEQGFRWPQWLALCIIAGVELRIPEIDLYMKAK